VQSVAGLKPVCIMATETETSGVGKNC